MPTVIEDKAIGGKIVFHAGAVKKPEDLVRGVFGISINELAQDIINNVGGKYDALYAPVCTVGKARKESE